MGRAIGDSRQRQIIRIVLNTWEDWIPQSMHVRLEYVFANQKLWVWSLEKEKGKTVDLRVYNLLAKFPTKAQKKYTMPQLRDWMALGWKQGLDNWLVGITMPLCPTREIECTKLVGERCFFAASSTGIKHEHTTKLTCSEVMPKDYQDDGESSSLNGSTRSIDWVEETAAEWMMAENRGKTAFTGTLWCDTQEVWTHQRHYGHETPIYTSRDQPPTRAGTRSWTCLLPPLS